MCRGFTTGAKIYYDRGVAMDKIKELGWKPVAGVSAVLALLAGILGVAGKGVPAIIFGVLAAVAVFGGFFVCFLAGILGV